MLPRPGTSRALFAPAEENPFPTLKQRPTDESWRTAEGKRRFVRDRQNMGTEIRLHTRRMFMDLELATTMEILEELRNREMHFIFVGIPTRNRACHEIYYACQGVSQGELLLMVRLAQHRLIRNDESNG